jgi:hypothetical protein
VTHQRPDVNAGEFVDESEGVVAGVERDQRHLLYAVVGEQAGQFGSV